eukprot:jgi/Mesen1/9845/ME000070S09132
MAALSRLEKRQVDILASIEHLASAVEALSSRPSDSLLASDLLLRQERILERIEKLEQQILPPQNKGQNNFDEKENGLSESTSLASAKKNGAEEGSEVQQRLERILIQSGATDFRFTQVPSDYYDRSFEERQDLLGAASVEHLCKSIVMARACSPLFPASLVNTQAAADVVDCRDPKNSKYYVIIVQYAARLNAEKVRNFVHALNGGAIPKKRFNLRLAPEDVSDALTGFTHNAVTPVGMLTPIPVILSDAIVKLQPPFFWLGGGEVDLKLGIRTREFLDIVRPFVADCIY